MKMPPEGGIFKGSIFIRGNIREHKNPVNRALSL